MSSPTPLVEQGNSIEGYLPRGRCEMLIAGATYAIWEAIYAFPEGSTKREWDEWVEHMSKVAKDVLKEVKGIAKEDKHAGVSFVPFIIWNFLRLHSNYENHFLVFDLGVTLHYDPSGLPKGVRTDKLRACPEDQHFVMDVEWMSEYVTRWNTQRKEKGWPVLELDRTPYKGRYIPSYDKGTNREASSQPHSNLLPKPLLDEAQLKPRKRKRSKGKAVDRSEPASETSTGRGRSHEPRKLSGSTNDEPTTRETSNSKSPASAKFRRSSRHRTPSRAPVPKIVSRRSNSPPPKRVKTAKSVTIDLTAESRSPSRSRSDPRPKTQLKSAMAVASTSSATSGDQLTVLTNAILRDVRPSRFIMNSKSGTLWTGFLLLPPNFWLHIPKDKRLDLFQQALVACFHCAVIGFPCYRQLGIAVACVRCRVQQTQCSQTFRKDGTNIENPYAHMLARYMLCWQIHHWVRDEPLITAYRDFTGCSLMPGVPLKFMPGMRAGKSKEHKAVAIGRVTELSTMSDWKKRWHGADYTATAKAWRYYNSGSKDGKKVALKHTPPIGALLPDDIQKDLDSYYEKLIQSDRSFDISKLNDSSDDDDDDEDDDDDDDDDSDDNESVPVSGTPSVVGPEDNPSDIEVGDDLSDETDEFDNDDTIVLAHSTDTPLVTDAPSVIGDNADLVNADPTDIPPPIGDILPPIDVTLPPTNGMPPPIDTTLPPINDTSASVDDTPPPADEGLSLVDDPLTPLENTPSPIDVDFPPPTADGHSPVSDVLSPMHPQEDTVMHELDQDADGDTNVMTLSDIIIFPTSSSHPVTATSGGIYAGSGDQTVSISTFTQPVAGHAPESNPLPTSSRITLDQVPIPSGDLMSTQAKELLSESEGEELQRLRKVLPRLTEEIDTQQRLVASLHNRLADFEHNHKQTQLQLDAVNEELRMNKLQHTLLQDQTTSAARALSASIMEQMRSDQESQLRAIHSAVEQSVDRVLRDVILSSRTATSTATPTHARDGTFPQTLFTLSLSPNRLNRRPNPDISSRYSEHPLTATITDSSPTPAHPSTSNFITSSVAPTRVAGPAHDSGDTFEDTIR